MTKNIFLLVFLFIGCKPKVQNKVVSTQVKTLTVINKKPVLVLDAGHGAVDPGAVNDSLNLYEKNITRKIVDAVLAIIDTNKITIIQTRPADSNIHRHQRINLANKYNPDLLLTVHINHDKDTSYNGFEIGFADSLIVKMNSTDTISIANPNKGQTKRIATTLSNNIAAIFPRMRNRNIKNRKDRIWMIAAGDYPSLLLEFGFLSCKKDLVYINDKKAIKKLANGIVSSIYKELLPDTSNVKAKI